MTLLCATCSHWQGDASSYAATCALASYPGRVPFDMTCDKHSAAPQPTPALDMQSQVRGPWMGIFGGPKP